MDDTTPLLEIRGHCATITLNRPSQHNRMDPDDLPVLLAHLAQSVGDPAIKIIVLTASGNKTFSAGYTFDAILNRLDDRLLEKFFDALERCPKLTIAAMRGSVYGGATDMALCCDIRLGIHGTRLLMPAAKIGLHYYPHGIRRYLQRLGHTAASQLFLTATPIDADTMLRLGFLTELVDEQELDKRVAHYTALAEENAHEAVALMKQSLRDLAGTHTPAALEQRYLQTLRSPELATRLEKLRKP
jgi:enoyl-CoA hydratase/carnithine racemase